MVGIPGSLAGLIANGEVMIGRAAACCREAVSSLGYMHLCQGAKIYLMGQHSERALRATYNMGFVLRENCRKYLYM